jgi:hypothetical protein
MHSPAARVIDMVVTEPLLGRHSNDNASSSSGRRARGPPPPAATPTREASGSRQPASLGPNLQFTRRFCALMALLRPYPALALSLLAVAEALVVAEGAPAVPPHRAPCFAAACAAACTAACAAACVPQGLRPLLFTLRGRVACLPQWARWRDLSTKLWSTISPPGSRRPCCMPACCMALPPPSMQHPPGSQVSREL